VLYQPGVIEGPRLLTLGGHNDTFTETLTLSGVGLVKGGIYREYRPLSYATEADSVLEASLIPYNATTGAAWSVAVGHDFIYDQPCWY
jgi:hypothetical protein